MLLIKALIKADEEVIKEIKELELICQKHDKLNGGIYLDNSLNLTLK